jgi:polyphosphate glucokinase
MSTVDRPQGIGTDNPAEGGADTPHHPFTLAVDIGGTGLKASVLDATGAMVADRVKVPTTYPCPPTSWWST